MSIIEIISVWNTIFLFIHDHNEFPDFMWTIKKLFNKLFYKAKLHPYNSIRNQFC